MKKNEGIKHRLIRGLQEAIYRYWVNPLQTRIPDVTLTKLNWQQRVFLKGAQFGVDLGRLAITNFKVYVRRLQGPHWSVIYMGTGSSFEEICHILFPDPPEVEELSHTFLWQVPALTQKYVRQNDLVVCELNRIISWRPQGAYVFTLPSWIRLTLDISRPLEEILAGMNQNMRRNLRKVEKHGFSHTFTQKREDFDLFYHKMHHPYISERHGTRAVLADYDALYRLFKRVGLILVKHDQEPIAGVMCRARGDTFHAAQMGVLEERFDLVDKGANIASWWFALEWARGNGFHYFDLGASRPYTKNGTFNFKRQWGAHVVPQGDIHTRWIFYSENLSAELCRYLNEQGFISEVEGLHYQVLLLEPGKKLIETELIQKTQDVIFADDQAGLSSQDLIQKEKIIAQAGLNGLLLLRPHNEKKVFESMASIKVSL